MSKNAEKPGKPDLFPLTLGTWYHQQRALGPRGCAAVNQHIMATYALPLRAYFLGTRMLWLGEPDEVINGFFASRLSRPDFLDGWQSSGMRLRRWLMNALGFYLHELRKRQKRDGRAASLPEDPANIDADLSQANDQAERAAARAFVHAAMEQARNDLMKRGYGDHWQAMIRHHVDGVSFRQIAVELGVDEQRADVMHRTAMRQFRRTLEDILLRDGVMPEDVDHEIVTLLKALQS